MIVLLLKNFIVLFILGPIPSFKTKSISDELRELLTHNHTKLEFILNNSTLIIEILNDNQTDAKFVKKQFSKDDYGAFWFSFLVIGFYCLVVFLVLCIRVKPSRQDDYNDDRKLAKWLLHEMREHTANKSILEQLKDREYRAKAWGIYASDRPQSRSRLLNQSLIHKEPLIINSIQKRIEVIERRKDFLIEYGPRTPKQTNIKKKFQSISLDRNRHYFGDRMSFFQQTLVKGSLSPRRLFSKSLD